MRCNISYRMEMLIMETEQLGSMQSAIVDAVEYSPCASKEYLGALQQVEKLIRSHSAELSRLLEQIAE